MAQLGTVLEKLFQNAGIDITSPEIVKLMQNGEVYKAEVPDNISTTVENLITLDSAKNNPILKSHFRAQSLNGVDATIKKILEEYGDEELMNEVLSVQGTEKRLPAMYNRLRELEAKKVGAKSKDKDEYQKEIDKLNSQIADIKKGFDAEKSQLTEKFNNDILNYAIQTQLSSFNYANDTIPKDVQVLTAYNLLQKELANKKVKITRDEHNNIHLKQSDNPELDYFENNKKVSFGDFASQMLANNKLLKVANTQPQSPTPAPAGTPQTPIVNNEAVSFYRQQLEAVTGN